MRTYTIYPDNIDSRVIDKAVALLREGGVLIYPTDTLYAMGCDALNPKAVEKLCRLKGIDPDRQLLSIICSDIAQASEYSRIDNRAFRLLRQYTPGPFTFVLPAAHTLPRQFKGRKTVGVRIPDNAVARAIASALGNPVMSSSVAPDDPDDIVSPAALAIDFEYRADALIDGGEGLDVPSTVVDVTDSSNPTVLREGAGQFAD
ncbi:MAG: threonylcarbamoyl-AMP synthase [Muribaculaceae bacterium]|nr:threonylcarbamoyl-AMP synthase [Muribaculaceae bacterium]